jgi:hypothetical protein
MAGILTVTPVTNISSTGRVNGTFTNLSTTYTLTNTGDASLTYTVSNPEAYVSLSNASGTLGVGATIDVLVYLNNITLKNKAVGTYNSTITFTSSGDGSTTRSLSVAVAAIEPYAINFLPVNLRTNEFFMWFCDLIDYVIITLKHTDDILLHVPNEFIDLIGGAGDESNQEAILAYYNTMVRPSIGTQWLMDTLLLMFEAPYTIKEWWESDYDSVTGQGDSFKFKIIGDGSAVDFTAEEKAKLLAVIKEYKNERSVLEGIIFELPFTDTVSDSGNATVDMADLSLSGTRKTYNQYDGDDGGGAGSFTYDGSYDYDAIAEVAWS